MGSPVLPASYPPPVLAYARSSTSQISVLETGTVSRVSDAAARWWFLMCIVASLFVCFFIGLVAYVYASAAV